MAFTMFTLNQPAMHRQQKTKALPRFGAQEPKQLDITPADFDRVIKLIKYSGNYCGGFNAKVGNKYITFRQATLGYHLYVKNAKDELEHCYEFVMGRHHAYPSYSCEKEPLPKRPTRPDSLVVSFFKNVQPADILSQWEGTEPPVTQAGDFPLKDQFVRSTN